MCRSDYDLQVNNTKLKSCFNFNKDIAIGAVGEAYVKEIFGNKDVKLEVKKDDWAVRSGNIATKSDFWCHVVGHYFVLTFPVDFLKKMYEKFHTDVRYVKAIGDRDSEGNPTSKAILIPWKELIVLFKEYEPNPN